MIFAPKTMKKRASTFCNVETQLANSFMCTLLTFAGTVKNSFVPHTAWNRVLRPYPQGLPLFSNNRLEARERETASTSSCCIAPKQILLVFCLSRKSGYVLHACLVYLLKQFSFDRTPAGKSSDCGQKKFSVLNLGYIQYNEFPAKIKGLIGLNHLF